MFEASSRTKCSTFSSARLDTPFDLILEQPYPDALAVKLHRLPDRQFQAVGG